MLQPFTEERQTIFPPSLNAEELAARAVRYTVACAFPAPKWLDWLMRVCGVWR
jgi:hypothetical protein